MNYFKSNDEIASARHVGEPRELARRTILAGALGCAFAAAGGNASARLRNAGDDWPVADVVPVRTVDPLDEDFSDVEPIGNAVADARIVQLGEPSHGAGSAFAAKARLIKFLHQCLGFDVLIWESGLYDVALTQAGMRGTDDGVAAARRGLFSLWSEAAEARPLFDYVKASQATLRPIEMAGFDMQITADGSAERYELDLRIFTQGLRNAGLRDRATALAAQATNMRKRLLASNFGSRADVDELSAAARELRALIGTRRTDFEVAWGPIHTEFMDHTVENMRADALQRFDAAQSPPTTPERENRRDALNAVNLRWLVERRFPGRKVVVWAHNVHVMKAYYSSDFRAVHLAPKPRDMKPTGIFLEEWFGRQVYTIGITAFDGSEGFAMGGPVHSIPPAPEGSFEAHLHGLGCRYAFLDFRHYKRPATPAETIRIPKFETITTSDPGGIYDGVFYIDHMLPATRAS